MTELLFGISLMEKAILHVKGYYLKVILFNKRLLKKEIIQEYLHKEEPDIPDFVYKHISCLPVSKKSGKAAEEKYNNIEGFATFVNEAIKTKFIYIHTKYNAPRKLAQENIVSIIKLKLKLLSEKQLGAVQQLGAEQYINIFKNEIQKQKTFLYFQSYETFYVDTTENIINTVVNKDSIVNELNTIFNDTNANITTIKLICNDKEYDISRMYFKYEHNIPDKNKELILNVSQIHTYYVPSHFLNNAILDYVYDREHIKEDIRERFIKINEYIEKVNILQPNYLDPIYAFHGTTQKLHDDDGNLTTYTFMSTTTSPYVALEYAGGLTPYIYIFRLGKPLKYIVFNDHLHQILIPYGVEFTVVKEITWEIKNKKYNFVFCNYNAIQENILNVINKELLSQNEFYKDLHMKVDTVKDLQKINTKNGSGMFYINDIYFLKH